MPNGSEWRLLPRPPAASPCSGAIVTSVSGDTFVPYALCLVSMLRRVNTTCPIAIVYDDVNPSRRLPDASLRALQTARAVSELIPLSALIQRALRHPAIAWTGALPAATQTTRTSIEVPTSAGRRLLSKDGFGVASNKLWLWALDPRRYPRVAYLDVDVAVLHNIDALLSFNLTEPIAAVGAAPLCQSRSFNSGLLVFKPSVKTLAKLLFAHRVVQWPWRGEVPDFDEIRLSPDGEPRMIVRLRRRMAGAAIATRRRAARAAAPRAPSPAASRWLSAWDDEVARAASAELMADGRNWTLSAAEHCAPAGCTRPDCLPALKHFLSAPVAAPDLHALVVEPLVRDEEKNHHGANAAAKEGINARVGSSSSSTTTTTSPNSPTSRHTLPRTPPPRWAQVQQALYSCQSYLLDTVRLARAGASFREGGFLSRGHPKWDIDPSKSSKGGSGAGIATAPLGRWVLKSCEPGLHDQSALNWLFEHSWHRLPRGYNVQPRLWDMLECSGMRNGTAEVAVLHYAGPAKPWWRNPTQVPMPIVPLSKGSIRAWRRLCPAAPLENGVRGKTRGARKPKACESWKGAWASALYPGTS